jgi:nucleoside-diphosphate-sugar epimerase
VPPRLGAAVVTGGAGFIGTVVAAELARRGYAPVHRLDLRDTPGVTAADVARPGGMRRTLDWLRTTGLLAH